MKLPTLQRRSNAHTSLRGPTKGQRQNARSPAAPWAWAGWGSCLGALCALLLFAPAQWLADAVASQSKGLVQLAQARGTVWNGSARLLFTGGEGSQDISALPERVQWTLRPAWSGLHIGLLAECCTPQVLQVSVSPRWAGMRLDLADAQSTWPAQLLSGLGAPWNTLQAQGRLQLQSQALSLEWNAGRMQIAGSAELQALDMGSRLSTLRPMGSYRLRLTGGSNAILVLDTLEGALQLSGRGQWVGARLRFSGEASATAEREAALSNLLNIIGRRNGLRSTIQLG